MGVASTIGIINQKDGTGKSTHYVNQGVDLAHEGEKALPVDRDLQGSQTSLGDMLKDGLMARIGNGRHARYTKEF